MDRRGKHRDVNFGQINPSTCSSSLEAYDREVHELKDGVLSLEAYSQFDMQVLQDWIFPIIFDAGRKTPMRARWTNGDFYGAIYYATPRETSA
jgi:hypothetical protein